MGPGSLTIRVAATLGLVAAVVYAGGGRVRFSPGLFDVGESPLLAATGDFDGDGDVDLAVTNVDSNDVTILVNDGSGSFAESASSPVAVAGTQPAGIAAGDLDGDGDVDLAVANFATDGVSVLVNDGGGQFSEAASSPEAAGDGPTGIAVADVDGDGDVDLAVTNQLGNNVSVLVNDGGGDFSEAASSPVTVDGIAPIGVAAGDLDGDGTLDLAVANYDGGSVSVLLNDGEGGLSEVASSPEGVGGSGPFGVLSRDFNGDGALDLATANRLSDDVSVLLNDGEGDFAWAPGSPFEAGHLAMWPAVGDFDGDGRLDLAVTNEGAGTVTILVGNGAGGFDEASGSPVPVGAVPGGVVAGDFDGDGRDDLATANGGAGQVAVLLGIAPREGAPTCFGLPATIVGSPGDDHIQGTNGADVIVGLGGDDQIKGDGGVDRICGGDGDDVIDGGGSNDFVDGGPGADVLAGGGGDDTIIGGDGDDRCDGGGSTDTAESCETTRRVP